MNTKKYLKDVLKDAATTHLPNLFSIGTAILQFKSSPKDLDFWGIGLNGLIILLPVASHLIKPDFEFKLLIVEINRLLNEIGGFDASYTYNEILLGKEGVTREKPNAIYISLHGDGSFECIKRRSGGERKLPLIIQQEDVETFNKIKVHISNSADRTTRLQDVFAGDNTLDAVVATIEREGYCPNKRLLEMTDSWSNSTRIVKTNFKKISNRLWYYHIPSLLFALAAIILSYAAYGDCSAVNDPCSSRANQLNTAGASFAVIYALFNFFIQLTLIWELQNKTEQLKQAGNTLKNSKEYGHVILDSRLPVDYPSNSFPVTRYPGIGLDSTDRNCFLIAWDRIRNRPTAYMAIGQNDDSDQDVEQVPEVEPDQPRLGA